MTKYELLPEPVPYGSRKLYRIRALVDIPRWGVEKGDLGGFVESEGNLSQTGDAWIAGNARVLDQAMVADNVLVSESALVFGHARLLGDMRIYGNALVSGGERG